MTVRSWKSVWLAAIYGLALAALAAERKLPDISAKSLNGHEVKLPDAAAARAYVLTFGFSHASQKAVEEWDKLLAPAFSGDSKVAYYEMPVLEAMPSLVRPMALSGMRKGLSGAAQSRFVPLYKDEKALKALVDYSKSAPDAGYVVVASGAGVVAWTGHDTASPERLGEIRKAVAALTN